MEKNKRCKPFSATLIVVAILLVTLIPMVSALEFDNVKDYDPITKRVTITNVYGLGQTLAELQLISPLNLKVGAGYQKVAEFTVDNFKSDYGKAFQDMNFYDMKIGGEEITREFDYKYLTYEDIQVPDYEIVCSEKNNQINGTYQDCQSEETGWHWEEQERWETFSDINELVPNSLVTVGIFTEVQVGDYVEWIPTFMGVTIEEWATWEASLNTDNIAFYDLENTSAVDRTGISGDGTSNSVVYGTGIVGNAFIGDGVDNNVQINGVSTIGTSWTVSMWFNTSVSGNGIHYLFDNFDGAIRTSAGLHTAQLVCIYNNIKQNAAPLSAVNDSAWHHLVCVSDGTNARLYLDGVSTLNTTVTATNVDGTTAIGSNRGNPVTNPWSGYIDEFGVWNRSLTVSEIINYYNGGDPPAYQGLLVDDAPIVTLNSPANASELTDPTINFNCTASDDSNLINVTFILDGVDNETNSTGLNNSNYIFERTLADGSYNWTCRGVDNASQSTTAPTRTFLIDSVAPSISLTSPVSVYDLLSQGDSLELNWTVNDTNLNECYYSVGAGEFCYQESANTSNQSGTDGNCALNYTGNYEFEGNMNNPGNTLDGNFTTWGAWEFLNDPDYMFINYTKPNNSIYGTKWVTKGGTTGQFTTIPSSCWYAFDDKIVLRAYLRISSTRWSCRNSLGFTTMLSEAWPTVGLVYEEAVSWKIGTPLNCSANTTSFNYDIGVNNLTFLADDTLSNFANATSSWYANLTYVSQTYPSSSVESATEVYTADVIYNNSRFSVITGSFYLNGTVYAGTLSGSGTNVTLSANVLMPQVTTATNVTGNWVVGLTDVSGITYNNLTANNVTVSEILFGLCNGTNNVAFWNYTIKNESNLAEINASFDATFSLNVVGSSDVNSFNYSDTSGLNSQYDFCIDPSVLNYTISTAIELTKTGYTTTPYNFADIIITNSTREDNLYMLTTADSTSFIVHTVYTDSRDLTEAEVQVQRFYPGINQWLTTEIITTNYVGEAVGHFLSEDANYRFLVSKSGISILNSSATKIVCAVAPCTVTLVIPITVEPGAEPTSDLASTLVYSALDKTFTYTYSDTSGDFDAARLEVVKVFSSNATQVVACNETKGTSSGVIVCNMTLQFNGTYVASGYITRDSDEFLDKRITGVLGTNIYDAWGLDGVLWAFFLFMGIVMIGISRPSLAIIFGTVGLIFLSVLQIINIGALSLVAVAAIAIILLSRVGKE